MNDGSTPNEVLVRLVNTSNKIIDLATSNPASTLQVSIAGQPPKSLVEWALSEMDNLQNIQLHWGVVAMTLPSNTSSILLRKPLIKALPKGTKLNITPPASKSGFTTVTLTQDCDQGAASLPIQTNENVVEDSFVTVAIDGQEPWLAPVIEAGPSTVNWTLKNGSQASLKPGDSLTFLLTNIVTGLKSGTANISISYANIPGYWDGQFTIQLAKTPIVNFEDKVGIGFTEPKTTLDVNGNISVEGNINQQFKNPGKMGASLTLENSGRLIDSQTGIFFKTYPTGNCDSSSAIIAKDDGNFANNVLFQFKNPGKNTNVLATQVTMSSSGMDVVGTIKGIGMVPPGAVLIQSGSLASRYDNTGKGVTDTPYNGWAICNGQNGTPNLQDRFIVGAGRDAAPNTSGGPDVHTHISAPPAQSFISTPSGEHTHGMPSAWYNRGLSCGCHSSIDTRATDVTKDQTQGAGQHQHMTEVGISPFNTQGSSGLNRPKYYALYFIMRLES
ncbi:hypothetical protein A9Q81_12965 [Gammaproteobacteria bacterium 42_54_T18]|mgnify:CR=1 FL=1|nr:hypothetical protein A9Q81_12965 [Gammaproteobacteria bacterium 42_54_T18]